ncbi:MAG TPA: insulinase family protein [Kofleriaceae bacterium]|nr:insulinase family protein [Kofleriaceae bacterium]
MPRCCLLFVLSACAITHYPPPAPPRTTHVGLAISTTTLANGQRVVLVNDPHAIDVQVTMRYQVGSINDGAQPGIAHFVEHLMFEQILDGQPLFTHYEDTASFFNAYTNFEATTYVARGPAEQLDKLLALEAARLSLPCNTITDAAFAREREVVINELAERDQTTEVYGAIHGVLFPKDHPYRQAIGGSETSIRAITREQACAFASMYYAPSNAVLVVSGNIGDRARAAVAPLGRVAPGRRTPAPRSVPRVALHPIHVDVPAPVDEDILVLAWPLPTDPELQVKVRAVAAALPRLVDNEIKGTVASVEFGDRGAPMFGLAVLPAEGETFQDATSATRKGIEQLPALYVEEDEKSDVLFDRMREGAVYALYSGLEDGSDRDSRLAAYVLAGRDPNRAFAAELDALRGMTRDEAAAIATQYLAANAPTVLTLKAATGKKSGQTLALHKPIHDIGPRRKPPDPALARKPADITAPNQIIDAKTRVLPNGLNVVLLPMSSVPTVDIRLIFPTGMADEAPNQRGLANLTAHALTWDLHHFNDVLLFAAAGGLKDVDVGVDRTTFSVQGMDTKLDVLLAGLRRLVREGTFDDDSAELVSTMRGAAKRADDEGELTDTWRAAVFGADHPYVRAGIARYSNSALTLDDAAQFRAIHYTPTNATLVIAGSFDPALADRWIDFLFADWRGPQVYRQTPRSKPAPASIGKADDLTMLQLRIAIPAIAGGRPEQLVAAEMLGEIARDIRFELAAGYSVNAQLSERRLARNYLLGGYVDIARSSAAIELIRDRVTQLRNDNDAAARAFVTARKHVIAQLLSRVGSAGSLAQRVEHDVEMERDPMSDLKTAATVRALTLDTMAATLADIDLSRATVMMRGPSAELKQAFDILGRKASYVLEDPFKAQAADDSAPGATGVLGTIAMPVRKSDVEPALTLQPPPRLALTIAVNALAGLLFEGSEFYPALGESVQVHAGYRYMPDRSIGARLAVGKFAGSYGAGEPGLDFTAVPIDIGAVIGFDFSKKRSYLEANVGLRLDRVSDSMPTRTYKGLGYGAILGRNLARIGGSWLALAFGFNAMSYRTSDSGATLLTVGLVLRR